MLSVTYMYSNVIVVYSYMFVYTPPRVSRRRFVSLSMGLSACNSSGHLSNHADVAPNHSGITFAIANTLVSHMVIQSHDCRKLL